MKKKVALAFLVLIGTMNCCPVYGQENINNTNTTEYVEDYTEYLTDNITMIAENRRKWGWKNGRK